MGTYQSQAGQAFCQACSPGTAQPSQGGTSCPQCPAGKYQALSGQGFCNTCIAGSYSVSPGSTQCTACSAGTAQSQAGQTGCPGCAAGTYQPSSGQAQCLSCSCNDSNACTQDTCSAVSGACSHPTPDGDADSVPDGCDNCPQTPNPAQGDTDLDNEGDLCDLNDGVIYLLWPAPTQLQWQQEQGFQQWNLYFGSLAVLRATGVYTQVPGSNPLAGRQCHLAAPSFTPDGVVPSAGGCRFALVTGVSGGFEGDLGQNSAGAMRPNSNPCP